MNRSEAALRAFLRVDFDWTMTLTGVWKDHRHHVPELHRQTLESVLETYTRLERASDAENPLGEVVVGPAGAGKTHFLSALRREVTQRGGTFLLADLTDVRDFWDTALQGAVNSLTRKLPEQGTQLDRLLDRLLNDYGQGRLQGLTAAQLAELRPPKLSNRVNDLVQSIAQGTDRRAAGRHEAVLRALTLLGSTEHNLLALGEAWLGGLDVREEAKLLHDLPSGRSAKNRLEGLAWALSLSGPIVIAIDQLDAIASEARASAREGEDASKAVFTQTTNGLMGLRDIMPRTLVVVSSLEVNWNYLKESALASVPGRFRDHHLLPPPAGETLAKLVERRLAISHAQSKFEPPYPTWPFRRSCFDGLSLRPREVLRLCERHRQRCRELGWVEEIDRLVELDEPIGVPQVDELGGLDANFEDLRSRIDPDAQLRTADGELDELLEVACRALAKERKWPRHLDVELDLDFGRSGQVEPLHARIRVIDHGDGDRERHLSLRFIQQANAIAFQARLKKAMTESGVGAGLGFRRLVIYRSGPPPTGPKTQGLVEALAEQAGPIHEPSSEDIRTLAALRRWFQAPPDGFDDWLEARQPVSQLAMFSPHIEFLEGSGAREEEPRPAVRNEGGAGVSRAPERRQAVGGPAPASSSDRSIFSNSTAATPTRPRGSAAASEPAISLGRTSIGIGEGEPVNVALKALRKHVAVLAAAGSGKTVLVRRVVEEAARQGVPAIVIDVANDLVRFGQRWPETPIQHGPEDLAAADDYFARTETAVWTPGLDGGNPVSADPIPDFEPLRNEPDELRQAQELAHQLLCADLHLTGQGQTTQVRQAILRRAIEHHAEAGGKGIGDLLRILRNPGDLASQFANGDKAVQAVADALQAQMQLNPLLTADGAGIDFDEMFGRDLQKTRVSVVNLSGLSTPGRQQSFLARLMTLMFGYAKRRPAKNEPLAGLVVIDEAKDFVPSQRTVASSEPIMRAAAQLRKYGYGMIVATQEPKSIHNQVVANCGTQVFGRALAPATQDAMRGMMQQLGGAPGSVGTLKPGEFYVSIPEAPTPQKIRTRLCLARHGSAATPDEVRSLARASRDLR